MCPGAGFLPHFTINFIRMLLTSKQSIINKVLYELYTGFVKFRSHHCDDTSTVTCVICGIDNNQ